MVSPLLGEVTDDVVALTLLDLDKSPTVFLVTLPLLNACILTAAKARWSSVTVVVMLLVLTRGEDRGEDRGDDFGEGARIGVGEDWGGREKDVHI